MGKYDHLLAMNKRSLAVATRYLKWVKSIIVIKFGTLTYYEK